MAKKTLVEQIKDTQVELEKARTEQKQKEHLLEKLKKQEREKEHKLRTRRLIEKGAIIERGAILESIDTNLAQLGAIISKSACRLFSLITKHSKLQKII